jgi:four helix bundle protein
MSYLQHNSSPLTRKSFLFGVRVVKMVKYIPCSPKEYGMINQVFRSGTAIGALVSEATYAQSAADFINKLSIALKECNETLYWLNILKDTEYINEKEYDSMSTDCEELLALLISSIKTTKNNNEIK